MDKPKNCFECRCFIPDKPNSLRTNGECIKFGYFVNAKSKACQFGDIRPELRKLH